jgi:hypothetical protein
MNNVEVLNTVETIANVNSELSEEQLDNINAGSGNSYVCDSELTVKMKDGEITHISYTTGMVE